MNSVFSVAANILLSFFPFLVVMRSLSRRIFGEQGALGALDLAQPYYPLDAEPLDVGLNRAWANCKNCIFLYSQIDTSGLIFISRSLALRSMAADG